MNDKYASPKLAESMSLYELTKQTLEAAAEFRAANCDATIVRSRKLLDKEDGAVPSG
jgi:hypothetical protein